MRSIIFLVIGLCCNACSVFRSAEENRYRNISDEAHEISDIVFKNQFGKLKVVVPEQDIAVRRTRLLEQINTFLREFPPSERTVLTTYTKADIELDLGDTSAAVASFEKFLSGMHVPSVITKNDGWGTWGFKSHRTNWSSKQLASIYLARSQYEDALRAISLTKKFVRYHYCGNERWHDTLTTRLMYAKSYLGMGRHAEALQILLPMVFNGIDPVNRESFEIPELALRGLLQDRTQAEVLQTLNEALDEARAELRPERGEWTAVVTQFIGVEVELADFWRRAPKDIDIDSVITSTKEHSRFYRLVSGLAK